MKIENLRTEKEADRPRVAATVTWEDCDRPSYDLYFETEEEFAESLSCNPHAFLVGCIVPALHFGERRVVIDAEICPELQQGLITAMSWLRHWYYEPDRELVRIEAKTQARPPTSPNPERAGFFFSGGVDSFATLCTNRLNFPLEHPGSIKDGLLIYGLELDDPRAFDYVKQSLSDVTRQLGITLIPVYTNIYLNYRSEDAANHYSFWEEKLSGAAFSAIAHAFARRLTAVSIASTFDTPNVQPLGSHPALDVNYSSNDLRIKHDGIVLSRFPKTKLLVDCNIAFQHIRVCNQFKQYSTNRLNCGKCEKCIRTMIALLALGALDKTNAFPQNEISEELLMENVSLTGERGRLIVPYYHELPAPLAEVGRQDLARVIEHKISEHYNPKLGWKARIKRFDHKYLGGSFRRLRRMMYS